MTDSLTTLFRGDVYSSVDPFATAITFSGPVVSWVGEDEAAAVMGSEPVDLEGDLVTPGFVHAGLLLTAAGDPTPHDLLSAGITVVHVLGSAQAVAAFQDSAPESLTVVSYPSADGPAGAADAVRMGVSVDARSVHGHLDTDEPLYITASDQESVMTVLDLLDEPDVRARAQRGLWRIFMDTAVPEAAVDRLAATGIGLTLDPIAHDQPLASLLAGGAQVSFALSPTSPWQTLSAAVYGTAEGISARAAFNASTRFGFRAVGRFDGGVLAPGSEATAVRWRVGELVVQVADQRLAAWSTDPRSGTPGLPDLSGDSALPEVRGVWVRGEQQNADSRPAGTA